MEILNENRALWFAFVSSAVYITAFIPVRRLHTDKALQLKGCNQVPWGKNRKLWVLSVSSSLLLVCMRLYRVHSRTQLFYCNRDFTVFFVLISADEDTLIFSLLFPAALRDDLDLISNIQWLMSISISTTHIATHTYSVRWCVVVLLFFLLKKMLVLNYTNKNMTQHVILTPAGWQSWNWRISPNKILRINSSKWRVKLGKWVTHGFLLIWCQWHWKYCNNIK